MLDSLRASRGSRRLVIGPPQRRAVLAVLLLHAGQVVRTKELVDAVWAERPPEKASGTLQVHVSALRRNLEPDRGPHTPSRLIRSADNGYLIDPADITVDVFAFQNTLAEAERARTRGDLGTAGDLFRKALAGFRAVALPGVPGPFAALHRDILAEQRLTAQLDLIELDLHTQPGTTLDHDLSELLAAHPHRERLHCLNMRLLDHNGRRADALAAYANARRILVDDLGIEPGPELRRLHLRLLAGDPGGPVTAPRVVVTQRSGEQTPGRPPRQPWLVGQERTVTDLVDTLTDSPGAGAPVVLLHGMAGLGKTATAAWTARVAADQFPGGQYFLSADADESHHAAVLTRVERSDRCLLILDDVTAISEILPALPANPAAAVLITSRYRGRQLPFAARIELPPLSPESARELFARVVGHGRCEREQAAVDRLIATTAGVPSMLLSVAELLCRRPEWSITDYADRVDDDSLDTHLRPLYDRTYAELDPLLAKVFRLAAVHPGGPSAATIAAATGWPVDQITLLLEDLVDHNLIRSTAVGHYTFPPLMRAYALARAHQIDSTTDLWTAQQHIPVQRNEARQTTAA